MPITIGARSKLPPEPERRCACNHLEREHGATGTRPCLATIGDLLDRDFCPCDEFRPAAAKAAAKNIAETVAKAAWKAA